MHGIGVQSSDWQSFEKLCETRQVDEERRARVIVTLSVQSMARMREKDLKRSICSEGQTDANERCTVQLTLTAATEDCGKKRYARSINSVLTPLTIFTRASNYHRLIFLSVPGKTDEHLICKDFHLTRSFTRLVLLHQFLVNFVGASGCDRKKYFTHCFSRQGKFKRKAYICNQNS